MSYNNEELLETYNQQASTSTGFHHNDSHVDYDDDFHVDKHTDETYYDD